MRLLNKITILCHARLQVVAQLDGKALFLNNNLMPELPWSCNFGQDLVESQMCGFVQDTTDTGDWRLATGPINEDDPGPPADDIDRYSIHPLQQHTLLNYSHFK